MHLTLSRLEALLNFFFLVLGGQATIKEIAASFAKVYGIKPALESRGSLKDLYQCMYEKREKSPADVYSYMPLYVPSLPLCLSFERNC